MMRAIDRTVNRVSMYRLATLTLSGLAIIALILSLFSQLPFSPLAFIATAAVFVFVTGLTSWLIGYIFGVRAHGESSIITGLILLFIFTPSLEINQLVIYGLVAMLAGASKFLLAWRGRHIFNPVAIAAVIIGFTTLAFASWWVATPWLFFPTLIAGLLLLYKTNRLLMGAVFVATASVVFVSSQLLYGESFGASVLLIASWPILFFASFMLTEPLTLPAKKYQSLLVAFGLGILVAVPIEVSAILITPALALVLANLVAFIVSHRRGIQLQFVGRTQLSPSSHQFTFKTKQPLQYEAGQYIELTIPHDKPDGRGERRAFSITSAPGSNQLSIAVKFYEPSSSYKKAMLGLKEGAMLAATSINGSFTLPKDTQQKLVFLAGGIGVTPFISFLQKLGTENGKREVTMVYAVNSLDEVAYSELLEESNAKVIIVSAKTENLTKFTKQHPTVQVVPASRVTEQVLLDAGITLQGKRAYVSGPPLFVRSLKTIAIAQKATKVNTDYFSGY